MQVHIAHKTFVVSSQKYASIHGYTWLCTCEAHSNLNRATTALQRPIIVRCTVKCQMDTLKNFKHQRSVQVTIVGPPTEVCRATEQWRQRAQGAARGV